MRTRRQSAIAVRVLFALALAILALTQPRAASEPAVVLISFDGWRWDYLDHVDAPNLRALASRGVYVKELVPSFPSLTFPNHYTLVTGLYPAHHGIVSNDMADPSIGEKFSMSAATAKDPRWWGGEPIWVTAIRQGRRAAAMFWPGNEVEIKGIRPTYWQPFDDRFPNAVRIEKVLAWLRLPDRERPAFISLYFSDTDHAGHDYGPLSPELKAAAARVDAALGDLIAGIERSGLADRTTIVVVSDHGMTPVSDERIVFLDDYLDLDTIDAVQWNELLQIAPKPGTSLEALYRTLHGKLPHVEVYRRDEVPARLHFRNAARISPLVGIAEAGWRVSSHQWEAKRAADGKLPTRGAHGYDPAVRDMHGLFVAAGPTLRRGLVAPSLDNIHVYEFLCRILNLTPAPNDGSREATASFFAW